LQVTQRLDVLIKEIREKYQKNAIGKSKNECDPCDVLIVAHGHILRAFAARWINKDIAENPSLILEAGGVGTLRYVSKQAYKAVSNIISYEHHKIDEPAIILGGAFTVPESSNS